jgi:hypothetical protein
MPPYPEKQSPLLVRLKQKKPLMESEGITEPSTTTTANTDDGPKLAETAVKNFYKKNLFSNLFIFFRFILINNNNNNKMAFLYLLILQNPMVIMKIQH